MPILPRIPPDPLLPYTAPPGGPWICHIWSVFLDRGSSVYTGAGCAAIHITSMKPEPKRLTVGLLDAPGSLSFNEPQDGFCRDGIAGLLLSLRRKRAAHFIQARISIH